MISFDKIGMLFQFEAVREEHKFSKTQSQELYEIAAKMSELKSGTAQMFSSIARYKRLEKEYIEKLELFGGNVELFNTKMREFEKNSLPLLNECSKKLEQLKKSMGIR